jgi:hypothetical protein
VKGKDLLIIGAAVFVLYKLAQVKPQTGSGQYLTNMPVINTPSAVATGGADITLIDPLEFKFFGSESLFDAGTWFGSGQAFQQAGSGQSRYRRENPLPPSVINVKDLEQ